MSISFSLFQLLGQIWRKAKQTADTRHSERPSALLHPERPLLQHQYRPDLLRSLKTNLFIAIFTTAHARLKLYSALETLQQRVLYYDTDSVIYKRRPGQVEIPLGVFLGEFNDEVEGDPIIEFASGGAKNYGYETRGGKVECKVRGFSLNYKNKQILNFYNLRDNILKELDQPQSSRREMSLVDEHFFHRDQTNKRIRLIEREKKYGLVFDKRVIDRTTRQSYPFGYSRIQDEVDLLLEL